MMKNQSVIVRFIVMGILVAGAALASAQGTVTTTGVGTAGVHIESASSHPDVVVKTGNSTSSVFRVFNSSSTELLRVSANGNVGIGTSAPSGRLEVFSTPDGAHATVVSTTVGPDYAAGTAIGGLRLGWKFQSNGANNVDLQVIRGTSAFDGAGFAISTSTSNSAASIERMRITSAGKVGIGVTDPADPLEVNGNVRIRPASGSFAVGGVANSAGYPFFSTNATAGVASAFQLHSNFTYEATTFGGNFGRYGSFFSHNRNPQNGDFTDTADTDASKASQLILGSDMPGRQWILAAGNFPGGVETMRLVIAQNGFVGIGTTLPSQMLDVQGNIHVAGNINAKYQDVAEWVPSMTDLAAGTVVVLDPVLGNGVKASRGSYDTAVAGVVSAQPGISLGEAGAGKEQVATTGRVRVRVDASAGPIRVGDLLVTSDKPGMAMKSDAMEINGRKFHQPGTILGKALEAIDGGEGEILVLLSLQ